MKSNLPHLSALALATLLMASIAGSRCARAQETSNFFDDEWPSAAAIGDASSPYRAGAQEQPADTSLDRLPPGDRLVVQSRRRLEQRASVFAKLLHQSSLAGRQLSGAGNYWQQGGPEIQVYLELQIAGQDASMLQVANDRFLWIDRKLPTGRTVSRIDLRALRAEERAWRGKPSVDFPLKPAYDPSAIHFSAQHGGLPGLLASLVDNFAFMPPQTMRLSTRQARDAEAVEIPVYAVVGHWKSNKLAQLVGENTSDDAGGASAGTPARIPQEVLLLIGQTDLFPYRVEYRRLETPEYAVTQTAPPFQLSAQPLVVLELADVAFDIPIAAGQFDYAPPANVDWNDQTAALIQRMRRERGALVADRDPADHAPSQR